jgi:SAM-dependent methyltransferase
MTDIDFSEVGPAYTWRFPYFAKFFEQLAIAAGLNDKSFVLDLACGTGELAVGMSPYCGEVLGIDKSPEMLSLRRELPANVRFLKADLQSDSISIPRPASLVTIGRAIPYLDPSVAMPFLESAVEERGSVLVCAAGMSNTVPWRPQYRALCARYRKRKAAPGFAGRLFFAHSRWKEARTIEIRGVFRCRPEGIFRNALSHSNLAQGILADQERFLRELRQILAPYQDAAGVITLGGISWAVEYRCHE